MHTSPASTDLPYLNQCSQAQFIAVLGSIYEHSPWVAELAFTQRPFASIAALKHAMQRCVMEAGSAAQLGLIRAHPELAGKAAIAGELGAESTGEQALVGLHLCSAEEFATLHELNAAYNAKFGFPFIVAVKGDVGRGLTRQQIIQTFRRRIACSPAQEQIEALRQIGRIAEMRLNALFGSHYQYGQQMMDWSEELAQHSDEPQHLTCAYLTPAHRACAQQLLAWMQAAGMQAQIDAVGNVVGRYASGVPGCKTLITGSHFDTVRNGGKYDGRLGVLLPLAVIQQLHQEGKRLPFDLEVVAFADEEGVRYQSTFLGSKALIGAFDMADLDKADAAGVSMRAAMQEAGLPGTEQAITQLARRAADLIGFVEVHIEQGPVLLQRDLPVGVVTAIAGSSRYLLHLQGEAGHSGTTPMNLRRDAAAAAAEIILLVEQRCVQQGAAGLVGTVGQLQVPNGSVNVIAGACNLSLDIRAPEDGMCLQAVDDILQGIAAICARRGVLFTLQPLLAQAAAAADGIMQHMLGEAIAAQGLPVFSLASGAGHDAMCMAQLTPMAMLFVRCGNGGISHNPLESLNADDAEMAAQVFLSYLMRLAEQA